MNKLFNWIVVIIAKLNSSVYMNEDFILSELQRLTALCESICRDHHLQQVKVKMAETRRINKLKREMA